MIRRPVANHTEAQRTPEDVLGLVVHSSEGNLAGLLATFDNPESWASAHFAIDADGAVYELVPPASVAWHCAAFGKDPSLNRNRPAWLPDVSSGDYSITNSCTIGIELIGFAAKGFTAAQYAALGDLCARLCGDWELPPTLLPEYGEEAAITTHAYLQRDRTDPGPLFDWARFRAHLMRHLGETMRSVAWDGDWAVSQYFDDPCCRASYFVWGLNGHNGLDLACPTGTRLYAVEDGQIVEAYSDPGGYGLTLYVLSTTGRGWRYGHASQLLVGPGQWVKRGALLAYSGNTGNSTGPHLHLGVRPAAPVYANGFNGYVDVLPVLRQVEQEQEMATVAELEAQIAHLNSVNTQLAKERDFCQELKTQVEHDLTTKLAQAHTRIAELEAAPAAPPFDPYGYRIELVNAASGERYGYVGER